MPRRTPVAPALVSFVTLALAAALVAAPAFAKKPKPEPAASAPSAQPDDAPAPADSAADPNEPPPLDLHFTEGPAAIDLGHSLNLALPATDRFLKHDDADKVLKRMGNLHNEQVIGLVGSKDPDADWFAVIEWLDEGHVKDDEAVDADNLLKEMRDAQKDANEERVKEGFKALTLDGFQVPPAYDKAKHHLSWALVVSDKDGKSVNFNTRILGRSSYVSIDLVTDPAKLETFRGEAMTLLDATTFSQGQRYEDFNSKTDKVAEFGLAGLIAGGVGLGALKLAKIGLIAKFWNVILGVLIAAKKAVFVAFAAAAAYFKRIFGGKKKSAAPDMAGPPPAAPPPPDAPPAV
jgi:uncharacterized membrane-anchored protein